MKKNIDLFIGCVLVLYAILINLIYNNIAFIEAFFIIGFILILYHFIKEKVKSKNILNIINFLTAIGLIVFFIV